MEGFGPVAILCGGRGTRLQEQTHAIPKALVEIGGRPILWHVIRIYAAQGMRRFVLLTGYLGEMIEEFVATTQWPEPVEIHYLDTGLDTPTGGRLALAADRLAGGPFCATYADGVADIDLEALAAFHRGHGGLATVTVVRPRTQFGVAQLDEGDRVLAFEEKPRLDHWVNGGFFRRLPAHGFLGVHGHLQGRRGAQRPLERGSGAVGGVGPERHNTRGCRVSGAAHRRARHWRPRVRRGLAVQGAPG